MSTTPPGLTSRAVPRGVAAAAAVCLVMLAMAVGINPISSNDIWLHITTGRLILERHAVPTVDEYSFTRSGAPYVAHEWLAQVIFAILHAVGGIGALIALKPLALAAAAVLVALTARELGAPPTASFWSGALAIVSMSSHLYTRPHLFTFVGLAATGWLLARRRRGDRRASWALVGIELLWANLHGGFVLGIVLAAAMGAFTVAGAMALAAMINPRGPGLYSFLVTSSDPEHRRLIQEWFSPFEAPFIGSFHFYVYAAVLTLSLAGAWSGDRRRSARRRLPLRCFCSPDSRPHPSAMSASWESSQRPGSPSGDRVSSLRAGRRDLRALREGWHSRARRRWR